jgi:hypothetical protein
MHISTNFLFYLPRAIHTHTHTRARSFFSFLITPQDLTSHQAHTQTTKEANSPPTTVTHARETLSRVTRYGIYKGDNRTLT